MFNVIYLPFSRSCQTVLYIFDWLVFFLYVFRCGLGGIAYISERSGAQRWNDGVPDHSFKQLVNIDPLFNIIDIAGDNATELSEVKNGMVAPDVVTSVG